MTLDQAIEQMNAAKARVAPWDMMLSDEQHNIYQAELNQAQQLCRKLFEEEYL